MTGPKRKHQKVETPKSGTAWTRSELKQVLELYVTSSGKLIHEGNPAIAALGTSLHRTTRSVEAQLLMFRALERGLDYSRTNMNQWCLDLWKEHRATMNTPTSAGKTETTVPVKPSDDVIAHFRSFLPGGKFTRGRVPGFYVETGLDWYLHPKLTSGAGYLAILSGNAGDGKTAFIEGVIAALGQKIETGTNVYDFAIADARYRFILDGSEETDAISNEQLLAGALDPYREGNIPHSLTTVVAVNKGTILGFLHRHRTTHQWLYDLAVRSFVELLPCESASYVFLDLNDRSLFAGSPEDSLFGHMVQRLLADKQWETCQACPCASACVVKWNIAQLRKPVVAQRLLQLLKCIDLDDRLHFTARHAVTLLLGTVLSGASSCADISRCQGSPPRFAPFYAHLFGAQLFPPGTEISQAIRELDPALSLSPGPDDVLLGRAAELRWDALGIEPGSPEFAFLKIIRDAAYEATLGAEPIDQIPHLVEGDSGTAAVLLRMLKRRAYFLAEEGEKAAEISLPFAFGEEFNSILDSGIPPRFRSRLVTAINCAIGVPEAGEQGLIVPPRYTPGAAVAGWGRLIRSERITVDTTPARSPAELIEYRPREIIMKVNGTEGELASLSISLMLFEMLMRAYDGFLPVTRSQKDYLARLSSFFDQINSFPQRRVGGELVLFSDGAATLLARQLGATVHVLPLKGSIQLGEAGI